MQKIGITKKGIWKGTQRRDIHIKTEFKPHRELCKLRLQKPPILYSLTLLHEV